MKDVQGIQRGKCNDPGCECDEYRPPKDSGSLRCEYCDHTPAQHVKIIALGGCRKCGNEDNCDAYVSEDPNSYTDCQYCGCDAKYHAGSEKLRKPQKVVDVGGSLVMGQQPTASAGGVGAFQPRTDAYGKPVQSEMCGPCNCPGCPYPKRMEGGHILDYCSRTCARKHAEIQGSVSQQTVPLSSAYMPQPKPPPSGGRMLVQTQERVAVLVPPGGGPPIIAKSVTTAVIKRPTPPAPMAPVSYSGPPIPKACKQCGTRPANPGRSWCQQCYDTSHQ